MAEPETTDTEEDSRDPEVVAIATRLVEAMADAGLDPGTKGHQAEVWRPAGVNQGQFSRFVRGERLPGPSALHAIATRLGVRPAWLVWGEEPKRSLAGSVTPGGEDLVAKAAGQRFRGDAAREGVKAKTRAKSKRVPPTKKR